MGKINKILVPVDGSVNGCKAVDQAIFLAEKCKAELDFVYVASNINKDIPSQRYSQSFRWQIKDLLTLSA